jgi:hypothetical protein
MDVITHVNSIGLVDNCEKWFWNDTEDNPILSIAVAPSDRPEGAASVQLTVYGEYGYSVGMNSTILTMLAQLLEDDNFINIVKESEGDSF